MPSIRFGFEGWGQPTVPSYCIEVRDPAESSREHFCGDNWLKQAGNCSTAALVTQRRIVRLDLMDPALTPINRLKAKRVWASTLG